jgi:hypothetical protein
MASLGALLIEVTANTARIQQDMTRVVSIVGGAVSKMKRDFQTLQSTFMSTFAVHTLYNLAKSAAQTSEAMGMLNNLTAKYGVTAEEMVRQVKEASGGLLRTSDAARILNEALMKGFTPEQVRNIASWSMTMADASGGTIKVAEAFSNLVQTMSTGRERGVVKLLGSVIDLKARYGELANEMSKAEKMQAIYTLAAERMAKVQKVVGKETDSLADNMERFEVKIASLKRYVGEQVPRVFMFLAGTFQTVAAAATAMAAGLMAPFITIAQFGEWTGLKAFKGKTAEWTAGLEALKDSAQDLAEQAGESFRLFREGFKDKSPTGTGMLDDLLGDSDAPEKFIEKVRKLKAEFDGIIGAGHFDEMVKAAGADFNKLSKWVREYAKWRMDMMQNYADALALFYGYEDNVKDIMFETAEDKRRKTAEFVEGQRKLIQENFAALTKDFGDQTDTMVDVWELLEVKMKEGNWVGAIRMMNEGLAAYSLRVNDARDAVNSWEYAYRLVHKSGVSYTTDLVNVTLNAFRSMEEAIVNFVMTGKNSFRDFANSVIADLMRIAVHRAIIQPLAGIVSSIWPAFGGAKASGGPVMGGTSYLVGERGPEMFVPSSSGNIVPGGGGNVTINVKNESGQPVRAKSSRASFDAQGWVIDVVIDGLNRNVGGLRTALGGA